MKILRINASDTYSIRSQILHPNGPESLAYYEGDDDEQTFHLGAFIESKLVSVASFYFLRNDLFEDSFQYQLKGMATLESHRYQGLSSELLKMAFPIIKQNLCTLVWCQARSEAIGFYQKVGFEKIGEEFTIEGAGKHYLMFKKV